MAAEGVAPPSDKKTTCADCDCELGPEAINVKLGGKTVEVCCEECAAALKEADAAATTASTGGK